MDFIDRLRELSTRIPKQLDHIQTEEATKNAFVMPFLSALGYNVFDPTEVTPELNADIGVKKVKKLTMQSCAMAVSSSGTLPAISRSVSLAARQTVFGV